MKFDGSHLLRSCNNMNSIYLALKKLLNAQGVQTNKVYDDPQKQIFEISMALCGPQAKIVENPANYSLAFANCKE